MDWVVRWWDGAVVRWCGGGVVQSTFSLTFRHQVTPLDHLNVELATHNIRANRAKRASTDGGAGTHTRQRRLRIAWPASSGVCGRRVRR